MDGVNLRKLVLFGSGSGSSLPKLVHGIVSVYHMRVNVKRKNIGLLDNCMCGHYIAEHKSDPIPNLPWGGCQRPFRKQKTNTRRT